MFNIERAQAFGDETISRVRPHDTVIVEGGGGFVQHVPFNIRGFGALGALTEPDRQALAERLRDASLSPTGGVTGSRDLLAAIPGTDDRDDVALKAIAIGGNASTIQQAQRELESTAALASTLKISKPVAIFWSVASIASSGLGAYHGYKRNSSVGWSLWWALMGGLFPVITPAIALAQGFGKPKHSSLGHRRYGKPRRTRRNFGRAKALKHYRRHA